MSDYKLNAVDIVRRRIESCFAPHTSYFKHWGIILYRYDCIAERSLPPQIIEATRQNGIISCSLVGWEGTTIRDWEEIGYKTESFSLEEKECRYSDKWLQTYIDVFNVQKMGYSAIFTNCHRFILDLLCDLNLEHLTRKLVPMSAEHTFNISFGSSIPKSTFNAFKRGLPQLIIAEKGAEIEEVARSSWTNSIFTQMDDKELKMQAGMFFPLAASETVQLSKKNSKIFNSSLGNFLELPPWQLIHGLVEQIVGKVMFELYREEKYLADSIASTIEDKLFPSHGIRDIAFWLIGEAVSFLVRLICKLSSRSATPKNPRTRPNSNNQTRLQETDDTFEDTNEAEWILRFYNYGKDSMLAGTIKHIKSLEEGNSTFHVWNIS